MLNKSFYIIILICISGTAFSQIKGKVLNEGSGEPLAGTSIYFNNTSYGTTADQSGQFTLSIPAIANPELIVSCIGYEILVYKLPVGEIANQQFIFRLKAKQALLQDVLILSDDTRKKYLKIFTENFLGITEEAASSSIKNLDAVYFTKPPDDRNGLNANSDTPLVIVNKMLGYRIHFQLQSFYFNKETGTTSFYGYTRYENMGDKKRWVKQRRKVYYGSTMHFFRSLIANKLAENSYKIFVVRTDTIKEKNGEIKQMDMAIPVAVHQLLKKDSVNNIFTATWKNKLMVQYSKEPASTVYLRAHTILSGALPGGFRGYFRLADGIDSIQIDEKGIVINPMDIYTSGYWIYEKAANLLPYDYEPEAIKN